MTFLEKSELPFSECPTKIILLPHLNKCLIVYPLEKKKLNHPSPPPHLYPNHHAPDVFISFQSPLL